MPIGLKLSFYRLGKDWIKEMGWTLKNGLAFTYSIDIRDVQPRITPIQRKFTSAHLLRIEMPMRVVETQR